MLASQRPYAYVVLYCVFFLFFPFFFFFFFYSPASYPVLVQMLCLFLKVRANLDRFPDLVTACTLQHRATFEAGGTPFFGFSA